MSNFESDIQIDIENGCGSHQEPVLEVLSPRAVLLGPRQEVRRVLPNKERRMIGAWCFVDHYGPEEISAGSGMSVPPHPHSGLQTVSWLLSGKIHHNDSLGSDALIVPGELNLMTSGPGIAHAEVSPPGAAGIMHGIQLWVALPEGARHHAPRAFAQYRDLPVIERPGLRATVVMGEFEGAMSPATTYTPIVGVELAVDGTATVELRPEYEYGVLAIDEGVVVEGRRLEVSEIGYVGAERNQLTLSSSSSGGGPARALLLGGEPFEEQLVMWWNFIGRSHEEIVEFRRAWNEGPSHASALGSGPVDEGSPFGPGGGQFGVVSAYAGERLMAPPMPTARLKSRGRSR